MIERDDQGRYLISAEGTSEKGQKVTERPQTYTPDGQPRPVPDLPGLMTVSTRPDPQTLHTDVRREDGSLAGQAILVLSTDGRSLTVINSGFDSQPSEFKQRTCWDRRSRWRAAVAGSGVAFSAPRKPSALLVRQREERAGSHRGFTTAGR